MGTRLKMISVSWRVRLPYPTAAASSPPKSTRHWLPPFTLAPCLYNAFETVCLIILVQSNRAEKPVLNI